MHLFYSPGDHRNIIQLDLAESAHCIKVLRLSEGDSVSVINGKGKFSTATIISADPKQVMLNIDSTVSEFGKRDYHLHVAIAPTKNNERFEWFLEKSTEIGIDEITPLICHRSERFKLREDRLWKVLLSAVKQSQKAYLPVLNATERFEDFVTRDIKLPCNKFIAYCTEEQNHHLLTVSGNAVHYIILIGPEGDFTPYEVEAAHDHGYTPVSLGSSRLRTETAGVVTAQIISDRIIINKLSRECS